MKMNEFTQLALYLEGMQTALEIDTGSRRLYLDDLLMRTQKEIALLEQVVEAAKRAIAIIYDVGYAAIPTAIDLEEAVDRILDD